MNQPVEKTAGELAVIDIGEAISFNYKSKAGVKHKITAQLRQIYHNSNVTIIDITGLEPGEGADLDQYVLEHDAVVIVAEFDGWAPPSFDPKKVEK